MATHAPAAPRPTPGAHPRPRCFSGIKEANQEALPMCFAMPAATAPPADV